MTARKKLLAAAGAALLMLALLAPGVRTEKYRCYGCGTDTVERVWSLTMFGPDVLRYNRSSAAFDPLGHEHGWEVIASERHWGLAGFALRRAQE